MSIITTLDKAGRVVIPKSVRDELNIEPGDSIEVETCGDRVTLRPVRSASPLRKKRGVWVFHAGELLTSKETRQMIVGEREARDRRNAGRRR